MVSDRTTYGSSGGSHDEAVASVRRLLDDQQFDAALTELEAASSVSPDELDDLDSRFLRCCALLGLMRYDAALPLSLEIVRADGTRANYWHALCCALRGSGHPDLALQVDAYACKRFVSDLALAAFRGDTLLSAKNYAAAFTAFQPVLDRFGANMRAWWVWIDCCICMQRLRRKEEMRVYARHAAELIRQLVASNTVVSTKQLAELWRYQGEAYLCLKDWQAAETVYLKALAYDAHSDAIIGLYFAYRAQHKWRSALRTIMPCVNCQVEREWQEREQRRTVNERRRAVSSEILSTVQSLIAM